MSVALPAVIVFLLIVPGLVYSAIRPPRGSNRLPPQAPAPLSIEAVVVVVSSVVLHVVWFLAVGLLINACRLGLRPSPRAVLVFLSGHAGGADAEYSAAVSSIADFPLYVVAYFLGLYVFSAFAGSLLGPRIDPLLIRSGLLPDRQSLSNEWRKFFVSDERTITIISAVVDLGGVAYLFVGKLVELYFDPATQELDRFALEDVWRRKLSDDVPPGEDAAIARAAEKRGGGRGQQTAEELISDQWHSVEGHLFIIRYADAKTINVRYWGPM